jgi:hypothetical protein
MRRRCANSSAAFSTEFFVRLNGCVAFWAGGDKGYAATSAEFAPLSIVAAAFRTAHISPLMSD